MRETSRREENKYIENPKPKKKNLWKKAKIKTNKKVCWENNENEIKNN